MKLFFRKFFADTTNIVQLNAVLLLIAIIVNIIFQAFCQPSTWAITLLVICFSNTIFYPFLIKNEKYTSIVNFINGVSFCVFIYSVIFLGEVNFLGLVGVLLGVGILVFIPHFLVLQLFFYGFIRLTSKIGRVTFLLGVIISVSFLLVSGKLYQDALVDIEAFKDSNYQTLKPTFMTEKILGMGIIYHVEFCYFDGWRPPKHEPILNMGIWLSDNKKPLDISLEKRVELYKKFFPNKQLKFDCSCAMGYRDDYHQDKLWE